MYVMLVTYMGRVSCYTCCGQSITVQVRFNWPSVRFLHILLALLHLCFIFFLCLLFFFIPSLIYSLLFFSISNLIIFLFFLLSLFYPPLFCLLPCWRFVLPPHLQAPKSEKQKWNKEREIMKKGKKKIVWLIIYLWPHIEEKRSYIHYLGISTYVKFIIHTYKHTHTHTHTHTYARPWVLPYQTKLP